MDSIPLALQIASAAVTVIGTGGTITFAILSHRTASRALRLSEASIKLNEASQKFAHEERTASLRSGLNTKRIELFTTTYAAGASLLEHFYLLVHSHADRKEPTIEEIWRDVNRVKTVLAEGLSQLSVIASDEAVEAGFTFKYACIAFLNECKFMPHNRLTMKALLTQAQEDLMYWGEAARKELGVPHLSKEIESLVARNYETHENQLEKLTQN